MYYVLVAGNGKTSRANVEALMDDHYYANGEAGTLVIPVIDRPTEGQVWAAQFAKDNNKQVVVIAKSGASYDTVPKTTSIDSDNPFNEAVAYIKGQNSVAFLLWSDEDEDCLDILALCKEYGVDAKDLTSGLSNIHATEGLKVETRPPIPVQETLPAIPKQVVEEEEDDVEEDEEEDDEELEEDEELDYDLVGALQTIAEFIASYVVDELELRYVLRTRMNEENK